MKEKDIEQFFTSIQEDHQRLEEKVDNGFQHIAERFLRVDEKIDHLEKKMDSRFEQMETKFDEKLDRISDNVQVIAAMLQARQTEFNQLDRRVTKLEQAHA